MYMLLQRIRERLIRDFGFIESLRPDPRLISDSCDPTMLGRCKGTVIKPAISFTDDHFQLAA